MVEFVSVYLVNILGIIPLLLEKGLFVILSLLLVSGATLLGLIVLIRFYLSPKLDEGLAPFTLVQLVEVIFAYVGSLEVGLGVEQQVLFFLEDGD